MIFSAFPFRIGENRVKHVHAGSVLILALWALFLLTLMAVSAAHRASAEVHFARRMRARLTAYSIARAAVERAKIWMATQTNAWDGRPDNERLFRDVPFEAGVFSIRSREAMSHEASTEEIMGYGPLGEESRINLNRADVPLLAAFLHGTGGLDSQAAEELAASIVDWRDPDDVPLPGGAETDHYQRLKPSYACPNAPFRCVHELLLVKGMHPETFQRLRPFITVFGTGKINLNSAPRPVLLSVARAAGPEAGPVAESLTDKLAAFQEAGGMFRQATAGVMVSELDRFAGLSADERALFTALLRYATIRSTCFGGQAEGRSRRPGLPEAETRRISFVINRHTLTIIRWHED